VKEDTYQMLTKSMKALAALIAPALLLAGLMGATVTPAQTGAEVQPSDTAAYYKAKCSACHGAKAEKKFDAAMTEEQMVEVVLKGKKGEKPPNMPSYEAKGVNAEQAKALTAYMKQLKEAPAN
jgi:mono/diheme cytochrome c family protein